MNGDIVSNNGTAANRDAVSNSGTAANRDAVSNREASAERLIFENARLVLPDRVVDDRRLLVDRGRIEALLDGGQAERIDAVRIDCAGSWLTPGFIDLHVHGLCDRLFEQGGSALSEAIALLPRFGVTSLLPTICPQGDEQRDLTLLRELARTRTEGAAIRGFFLEGHYLSLTGAIANMKPNTSSDHLEALIEAAGSHSLVFGISPEFEGILNLLPRMTAFGMPAFITHTAATADQTLRAIDAGARHATHFYNVFPYPGDKEPGVRGVGAVEAVLSRPEVSVDFILDGEHVDPLVIRMAIACKGLDQVCLVTDANLCAGLGPGVYHSFGSYDVVVHYPGGPARMCDNDPVPGALAGSGLTVDLALRSALRMLGLSMPDAVSLVTRNPARVLGQEHRIGSIQPGQEADLVLLDDDLAVRETWVGGRRLFSARSRE